MNRLNIDFKNNNSNKKNLIIKLNKNKIINGNKYLIKRLIEYGTDINRANDESDINNETPLSYISITIIEELMNSLNEHKADIYELLLYVYKNGMED
ncbi:hypothetical protein H8356DRAFT_1361368 [Neocallimastix lanati (nom. inval.)]|nr:hypothetical protein H8356DRAFT_1361368 [Neocallimastix sp. JGI-2020a]